MKRTVPIVLIVAAALLYGLCRYAYFVGFFNDDAFYVIGARSLLQGRYVELNQPGTPPLVNYMPGYPALLAIVMRFFPDSFLPLQLFSVAMAAVGLFVFSKIVDGEESFLITTLALAAAAFNPLYVSLSAQLLSDIPYFLFSMLVFAWAARIWPHNDWRLWFVLAGLAGFTYCIRPAGLSLGLALLAALLIERRWKTAFIFILFLGFSVMPFASRQASRYASEYVSSYSPTLSSYYFREIFVRNLLRWPVTWKWLDGLSIMGGLVLMGIGALRFGLSGWKKSLLIYLTVYAIAHFFWSKESGRYIYPVFPFVAFFIFSGIHKKKAAITLAIAVGACYFRPLLNIVESSAIAPNALNSAPQETMEWIRSHTDEADIFAAELDGQLFLLTGRQAVHLPKIFEKEMFLAWMESRNVHYIWVEAVPFLMRTHQGGTVHDAYPAARLLEIVNDSKRFELAFSSVKEKTAVYRFIKIMPTLDTERIRT